MYICIHYIYNIYILTKITILITIGVDNNFDNNDNKLY